MKQGKPYRNVGYNWHHKKARINGGSGHYNSGNMVEVRIDHHRAFHMLFETKSVPEIARILNETWIDPEWELIARKKEKPDAV